MSLEVVKHPQTKRGFVLLPRSLRIRGDDSAHGEVVGPCLVLFRQSLLARL